MPIDMKRLQRSNTAVCVRIAAALAVLSWWGGRGALADGREADAFPKEWFFLNEAQQQEPSLEQLVGKPAPALSVEKWIGDAVTLKESRGKVVVIDFWATWCGPCRRAIPENVEMVERYEGRGLVFIGMHDAGSGWDQAPDVIRSSKINYPVALDSKGGVSAKAYGLRFFPTYIAIDKRGIVRAAGLLPDRVEDVVKVLLEEPDPTGGDLAEPEFAPEFYYGGYKRPRAFREIEGNALSSIEGLETRLAGRPAENDWIGATVRPEDRKDKLLVICFVSPTSLGMRDAQALSRLSEELSADGVVFLGVADARADWEAMSKAHESQKLELSIVRDLAPEAAGAADADRDAPAGPKPSGVIARDLGVMYFPATVVVDGAGTVRCAGVRADKVKAVVDRLLGRPEAAEEPELR